MSVSRCDQCLLICDRLVDLWDIVIRTLTTKGSCTLHRHASYQMAAFLSSCRPPADIPLRCPPRRRRQQRCVWAQWTMHHGWPGSGDQPASRGEVIYHRARGSRSWCWSRRPAGWHSTWRIGRRCFEWSCGCEQAGGQAGRQAGRVESRRWSCWEEVQPPSPTLRYYRSCSSVYSERQRLVPASTAAWFTPRT